MITIPWSDTPFKYFSQHAHDSKWNISICWYWLSGELQWPSTRPWPSHGPAFICFGSGSRDKTKASSVLVLNWVYTLVPRTLFIRIRIRIHLLARRNLLWDILRLLSSRRAALGLYAILTLWRGRGANQPPYALLHIGARPCYALRHGRRQ